MSKKSARKSATRPTSGRGTILDVNQIYIRVIQMKDIGRSNKDYFFTVIFDDEEVFRSPAHEGQEFEDKGRLLEFPFDVDHVTIRVDEQVKLIKNSVFKGQISFSADELYSGYNYDNYFQLADKNGVHDHGELRVQIVFVRAGEKFSTGNFSKPLHYLTNENKPDFIKTKIQEGASVNDVDADGATALLVACKLGYMDCVKVLADSGADLNATTRKGLNGIHLGAIGGHYEIVRLLVKSGVDPNLPTDEDEKYNALHLAVKHNHPIVVKALLKYGVDVDSKTAYNDTPLGIALKSMNDDMDKTIEYLLRSEPNIYLKNDEAMEVYQLALNPSFGTVQSRDIFMELLDIEDEREFEVRKTYQRYQRAHGKNLSPQWDRSTQMIVTVQDITPATIIFYQKDQGQNDIYYVITAQEEDTPYKTCSYQTNKMEMGNKRELDFIFQPNTTYHLCACSRNLLDDFGVVVYYKSNSTKLKLKEALPYPHAVEIDDVWDQETSGGNSFGADEFFANPIINITFPEFDEETICTVVLRQETQNVRANILDIVPGRYHIGFFLVDPETDQMLGTSAPWYDSLEIQKTFIGVGPSFDIVPCTTNIGDYGKFTVTIKANRDFDVQ
eukprot:TRINITY_DN7028_c0_g1_i1.p1 TRINITY_DN7028_c0_g1~~TRINITY_DN7028_c0_g1_i1.p1  ORF type:complete len:613 (+),score=140.55 TRINITY_DN7028_c0_g1_i1:80-1918(+)